MLLLLKQAMIIVNVHKTQIIAIQGEEFLFRGTQVFVLRNWNW